MSKPTASGGNEPPPFKSVGEMFDKYRAVIKARPRPTRRHWSYVAHGDGTITISAKDLAWVMSAEIKTEKERYEEDLALWYKQQGVSQEPYLKGETYEQYKARTGSRSG